VPVVRKHPAREPKRLSEPAVDMNPAQQHLSSALKGRQAAPADRVLDVLVPEVVLQGPRVVAVIRELEPTGMAKHVRVDRKWHLGGLAEPLDEAVE
jgi:hypothetical protein